MAIRGPQPKAQARNRNPLIHEWTEVERIPFEGGPDLPPRRANARAGVGTTPALELAKSTKNPRERDTGSQAATQVGLHGTDI